MTSILGQEKGAFPWLGGRLWHFLRSEALGFLT